MQAVYRPRKDTLLKTKIDKIDNLFKTKILKNMAGLMFPLNPHKGVPPPPTPGVTICYVKGRLGT